MISLKRPRRQPFITNMSNAALTAERLAILNAELERAVFAEPAEGAHVKDLCLVIGAPCNPRLDLDELVAASMRVALRMQAASAKAAA